MFRDRVDAGQQLGEALRLILKKGSESEQRPLILGLARGGVPVAAEVARIIKGSLGVLIIRKLGAPGNPEFALGAIAGPGEENRVIHQDAVQGTGATDPYLAEEIERQLTRIEERHKKYGVDYGLLGAADKTVIIVDDGIATGATMEMAIRIAKQANPKRLILAVPVSAADSLERIKNTTGVETVCLDTPSLFGAVGAFYDRFGQVSDDDVVEIMGEFKG